jgi:hypothetical protein
VYKEAPGVDFALAPVNRMALPELHGRRTRAAEPALVRAIHVGRVQGLERGDNAARPRAVRPVHQAVHTQRPLVRRLAVGRHKKV